MPESKRRSSLDLVSSSDFVKRLSDRKMINMSRSKSRVSAKTETIEFVPGRQIAPTSLPTKAIAAMAIAEISIRDE